MAKKDVTARKPVRKTEVIGYPEKPWPRWTLIVAAVAWGLWLVFLVAMAYLRRVEWPIYPS